MKPAGRYISGAKFERAVKKYLEECGWFVIRSAGSKGKVDLACFHLDAAGVLIQCKTTGKLTAAERKTLNELDSQIMPEIVIAQRDGHGGFIFKTIRGTPWSP